MNFQEFKAKYQKAPVEHRASNIPNDPVVSVCVQTYQHADYIEDCLEGILMQETDFPFEILLGEDASTDGTREICIEYAEKYPDKIQLFLHRRENNIKINEQPTGRFNFSYNLYNASGRYIALCEGDDYWTDPLKLQKQVQVFDSYPCCSLCFHAVKYKFENLPDKNYIYIPKGGSSDRFYPMKDFIIGGGSFIPTASMIFKSVYVKDLPNWFYKATGGDYPLTLILATKGKVSFLNEVMGVYRKGVRGSWSHNRTIKHKLNLSRGLISMYYSFNKWSRYQYMFIISFQVIKKMFVNIKQYLMFIWLSKENEK